MRDPLQHSHTAPKFAAADPVKTAHWYRDMLAFPRIATFPEAPYAIVARGALTLHLWHCTDPHIARNTACYVELASTAELDRLHAEWLNHSMHPDFAPGRIEASPRNQPGHGMREFHVWDPDGNLIGLGAELTLPKQLDE